MKKRYLSTSILLVAASIANSATVTWDGDTDASWQTVANWDVDPSGFGNTTDVVLGASGASNLVTYIGDDVTIRSLTVNDNTGTTDTQFNTQVSAADTTAKTLTFEADSGSATITRTSGSTGTVNLLNGEGSIVLASDLVVNNAGGRIQTQVAISETGGARDITIRGGGQFLFSGGTAPTTTGDLNVEEGLVYLGSGDTVSYSSGTINLGKLNSTIEARVDMTGGGTTTNDITVIADGSSAQSIVIGKNGNALTNVYSGTITLNDDVTFRNAGSGRLDFLGDIGGTGDIITEAGGEVRFRAGIAVTTTGDIYHKKGMFRDQIGGIKSIGTGKIYLGGTGETTLAQYENINGGTTNNEFVIVADGAEAQDVQIGKNAFASSTNFGGKITLNDDVLIRNPGGGTLFMQNNITGTGDVHIIGSDQINFNDTTDYDGDTYVTGDGTTHRLRVNALGSIDGGGDVFVDDAVFEFLGRFTVDVGANGVNNSITEVGDDVATRFEAQGNLYFDLGDADITDGNEWDVWTDLADWDGVDLVGLNVTSTVGSFTEVADVWTLVDGSKTWTFTESNGVLDLAVAIPEPSQLAAIIGMLAMGASIVRRRKR